MDKNAIKNYAIWARNELIARVNQKALQYGIENGSVGDPNASTVNGRVLTNVEKQQRSALIQKIRSESFEQVIEEVAYTWFNRFCALRFMEVNDYLPSHVRVFSDDAGAFKPQIMAEAINLEMDGLDMQKVYAFKENDQDGELFKYLVITQCNALNKLLLGMFQRIADYTELLFPDYLLEPNSAVGRLVNDIPEEDWKDAVQIIGWLYQYYNTEPKAKVFKDLDDNIKITKEKIPAATQLFTPDWIVRYMVENSLGRLWLEGHPQHANLLKPKWKYYLDEAEQEDSVKEELAKIREEYAKVKPQDLRCIDPCEGSGHIVVYMFDVLVQIYMAYGYTATDAVASIVKNNLYGLDIDDRAAQLAYFAVMMKARQYDSRFLNRGIQPHIYSIMESNGFDRNLVEYFENGDEKLKKAMDRLVSELHDAKEYGSILNVTNVDFEALYARFEEIRTDASIYQLPAINTLLPFVQIAQTMAQKYDVVVTNPPYRAVCDCSDKLQNLAREIYPDSKNDLSTICMEKTLDMCKQYGFMSMINIPVWMSKSSFENLRYKLLSNHSFINMLHCGRGVFGSDFGTTAFTIAKKHTYMYCASFRRLFEQMGDVDSIDQKESWYLSGFGSFVAYPDKFLSIASYPIAYWVSDRFLTILHDEHPLSFYAAPRKGLTTGDNDTYVRLWYEIPFNKMGLNGDRTKKWYPMTKGGDFRRWYGNNDYVVNWEYDGASIKNFKDKNGKLRSRPQNTQFYFHEGISWNDTTATGKIAFRYQSADFMPNASGPCVYAETGLFYLFGLLNSKVSQKLLEILAPNMKFEVGQMALVPIINRENEDVVSIAKELKELAKSDWDSFETSWDFKKHPLVPSRDDIAEAAKSQFASDRLAKLGSIQWNYERWENECETRFNTLKANEEELNRIFIDIYGLQDELTPDVEDKDVTVRKADLERDIKSLISYAVGCMFGRYSLDVPGLAYAGGDWDATKYKTFEADADNIIPICDDEYFEDDIVGRFIEFVKVVYGESTLEDNLQFIANALGGKGSSREIIRKYFLDDFFKDHCNTYQVTGSGKRPIYWLFDSGKKNGFKCLVYMHRYRPDTIARIRTDYVHEQQSRYDTAIEGINSRLNEVISSNEQVRLKKQLAKLAGQKEEIHTYEEKIHHLADQMISIDLDDGVKVNYAKFKDVLGKIK
ncbi:BREX-1 system adenine-specific DNA-methyltransferase PglX [Fibrobacter sp. UWH4]|uniref:BREX-1 system adenine-specific DNA-methyltransferase PglX n=1 Tax=Fibrobacter sp. UWH4 TaxID=1896210 RepID=UPI000910377D|nr:hypothetical protein SAMN05720762_10569 [Fibrobacter sp. UWH4]